MATINVLLQATAKDRNVRKWFASVTKLADDLTTAADRAKASLSQLGQAGAGLGPLAGGVTGGAGGGRSARGGGGRGGRGGVPTIDRALANAKRSTARAAQREAKLAEQRVAMMAREGQTSARTQARADRRRARAAQRAAKNIENLSDDQLREIAIQKEINSRRQRAARNTAKAQLGRDPTLRGGGGGRFEMAENLATVAGEFEQVADRIQRGVESSATSFKDFQKGVVEVSTLTKDIPIDEIEAITKGAAEQFGGLPTEQVTAFYQIVSAGATDAASAQAQLIAANKLAIGGVAAPEEAVLAISKSVANFGAAGVDATKASDILFASVKRGQTTVSELARALPQAANAAATTGLRMEDLSASIAFLSTKLPNADAAAVGLAGAFANIQKPTKQARDEAKRLGIDFSAAGIEAAGGWEQWLLQLRSAEGFRTDTIGKLFDSKQARKAIGTLVEDMEGFNSTLADTTNSAGAAETAYGQMADTSAQRSARLEARIELLKIQFGEALVPAIEDLVKVGQPIVEWLTTLIRDNPRTAKTVSFLALGAIGLSRAMSGVTTAMSLYNATAGVSAARTAALGASQRAGAVQAGAYGKAVGGASKGLGAVPAVAAGAAAAFVALNLVLDQGAKPLEKFESVLDRVEQQQGNISFEFDVETKSKIEGLEADREALIAEIEKTRNKKKQLELQEKLYALNKKIAGENVKAEEATTNKVERERLNRQIEILNAARTAERESKLGGVTDTNANLLQKAGGGLVGAFNAVTIQDDLRRQREQAERDVARLAEELGGRGILTQQETAQLTGVTGPRGEIFSQELFNELIGATKQVAANTTPAQGPSMEAGLS